MGLLDRWTKREEKKKLEGDTPPVSVVENTDKPTKAVKSDSAVKKAASSKAKTAKKTVAEKSEKAEKTVALNTKVSAIADRILVKPLVTEKSAHAQSLGKYGFMVARNATKNNVKRAVFEVYGVMPEKVNMINTDGKWVRFGSSFGRRSDYKKAIVTLPAGKSITIHEGV